MKDKNSKNLQVAQIQKRINILKGQLDGLMRMVEKDVYCIDVLTQSSAVQQSLKGLDAVILERHLHRHVKNQFITEPDKAIGELLKVFKRSTKNDISVPSGNASYSMNKIYNGTFNRAIKAITKALKDNGFGVLVDIDIQATLRKKLDVDFTKYRILGVCNPQSAYKALSSDIEIGLLLPCNVIVYENDAGINVSVIKPTSMLAISNNPIVADIAGDVEDKLVSALDLMSNY